MLLNGLRYDLKEFFGENGESGKNSRELTKETNANKQNIYYRREIVSSTSNNREAKTSPNNK